MSLGRMALAVLVCAGILILIARLTAQEPTFICNGPVTSCGGCYVDTESWEHDNAICEKGIKIGKQESAKLLGAEEYLAPRTLGPRLPDDHSDYVVTIPGSIKTSKPIHIHANSRTEALINSMRPTVWSAAEWKDFRRRHVEAKALCWRSTARKHTNHKQA